LGGFDLDLAEGSRDAVSLSATDRGREFAVGLLDAMSYAIRQTWAVLSGSVPGLLPVGMPFCLPGRSLHIGRGWGAASSRRSVIGSGKNRAADRRAPVVGLFVKVVSVEAG
jgi:hypothetical protein